MEINSKACHEQEKECIICLDDVETEWRRLECQHQYHKQCIEDWITIKPKCPMCMKHIDDSPIEIIQYANNSQMDVVHSIAMKRFIICILCVVIVLVVMVVCSSYRII